MTGRGSLSGVVERVDGDDRAALPRARGCRAGASRLAPEPARASCGEGVVCLSGGWGTSRSSLASVRRSARRWFLLLSLSWGVVGWVPVIVRSPIVARVVDQGQISKLLSRLEGLGLLQNTGGHTRGVPNAWQLTPRGREILNASTPQERPSNGLGVSGRAAMTSRSQFSSLQIKSACVVASAGTLNSREER